MTKKNIKDKGTGLPETYGVDMFNVLIKNPNCLFVYWETGGKKRDLLVKKYGEDFFNTNPWVLRIDNLDKKTVNDIQVYEYSRHRYISVEESVKYKVTLGLISSAGKFIPYFRGVNVMTPSKSLSVRIDKKWKIIEEKYMKLVEAAGINEISKGYNSSLIPAIHSLIMRKEVEV